MKTNRTAALRIFRRRYRGPDLLIHEIGNTGANVSYPFKPNAWVHSVFPRRRAGDPGEPIGLYLEARRSHRL